MRTSGCRLSFDTSSEMVVEGAAWPLRLEVARSTGKGGAHFCFFGVGYQVHPPCFTLFVVLVFCSFMFVRCWQY